MSVGPARCSGNTRQEEELFSLFQWVFIHGRVRELCIIGESHLIDNPETEEQRTF